MPKPSLFQHDAMPDVLGSTDFRLTFSRVPGALGIDLQKIALNCTQAVIPGITVNKIEQRFAGGHKLNYGATLTHAGTAAMQFVERVDSQTLIMLKSWQEFVRGTKSGNSGGYKADYAVTGRLEIFDGPGKVASEILIRNMFIGELPETQYDATSEAQAVLYQATFSYDWWELVGQELR